MLLDLFTWFRSTMYQTCEKNLELLNTFFPSLACPFASITYWQEPLVLVPKYSQAQPKE